MSKVPCVELGGSGSHRLIWDLAQRLMMSLDGDSLLL
jgi:hypothetical protein